MRAILTICQSSPSTRCGRPSIMSSEPMLITLRPIDLAALIIRFWFSPTWNGLRGPRLSTRSSMVSGAATLIILESSTPSATEPKSSSGFEMGSRYCSCASPPSLLFMKSEKASTSSSAKLWTVPSPLVAPDVCIIFVVFMPSVALLTAVACPTIAPNAEFAGTCFFCCMPFANEVLRSSTEAPFDGASIPL